MKILKIIIGIIAILFVLAHVADIARQMLRASPRPSESLVISHFMGHIVGICIGCVVAMICFRKK